MKFIEYVPEGCACTAFIGWRRSFDSALCLHLRLWRLHVYWRLRSKQMLEKMDPGTKKIVWDIQWESYMSKLVQFDFNYQAMTVGDFVYTIEFMMDLPDILEIPEEYAVDMLRERIKSGVRKK